MAVSAEVLDKHLSMVQRDHEQKSQIVERQIRDDAAVEQAKRREQSMKEEKIKQERTRQEAEARQKAAAKLEAEAQKAAYEAAKKEAVEREAAKSRAEAMAQVTLTVREEETETEATPPIGVVTAQDAKDPASVKFGFIFTPAGMEALDRLVFPPPPPPAWRLARLWRRWFFWFDPKSIPVGQALTEEQLEMVLRLRRPGYFEQLAMDREVALECLKYYNRNHPDNEYEPAPGKVSRNAHFHNGISWTHGNFVARKKHSGYFSFLPAPRTLFFFELARGEGLHGVVTCTPLDEPVTESYSVLGFPLGFSTRRSGKLDSFCETCNSRFDVPHPGTEKISACGHNHVKEVCEMCYLRSGVLHPRPGGFAFGYCAPYRPYPTKH